MLGIETDTCDMHWGGHLGSTKVQGLWSNLQLQYHINCKGLLMVHLILKSLLDHAKNQTVLVKTDNIATKQYILNHGGTGSPALCALTLKLLMWCKEHGIMLTAEYILGLHNTLADRLSRRTLSQTEWSLKQSIVHQLFLRFKEPQIDIFASAQNAKFSLYYSWRLDPKAHSVDALSLCWSCIIVYVFSTDGTPSQSTALGPAGSGSIHDSNRSSLARSSLVSSTVRFIDRAFSLAPFDAQSSDSGTGQSQACELGTLVPGSMACKRRALVAQGLSEQVPCTILAARAVSMYKSYESGWKHYTRWCRRRSFNPFIFSGKSFFGYLQFCLRTLGLAHSSIRNRVYAIALYHVISLLTNFSDILGLRFCQRRKATLSYY